MAGDLITFAGFANRDLAGKIAGEPGVRLLGGGGEKLNCEGICEVVVSDTVAGTFENWSKLRVVSIAPLIAAAIRNCLKDGSLSNLY